MKLFTRNNSTLILNLIYKNGLKIILHKNKNINLGKIEK